MTEVVHAILAPGRKMRFGDLVRAVDSVGTIAGLLNARKDCERRAGVDARDAEQLPSAGHTLAHRIQQGRPVQRQILRNAQAEAMRDIEIGWALLKACVEGVL